MSEGDDQEAQFLAAIREAPANDPIRLVYADWLEEQGDKNAPRSSDSRSSS